MALSALLAGGLGPVAGAYQAAPGLADLVKSPQDLMPTPDIPKPKAFGKGGDGWKILGLIGDALQVTGGGRASYAPMVAEQQQLETDGRQKLAEMMAKAQAAQEARRQALEDQKTLIDYRAANPGQDSFGRALTGAGIDQNSPEAKALYRKRAEMLTNPVQLVPDGMGGYQAVRPNEAPASSGPQPGQVEDGYAFMGGDPSDPANWKQVGGASSNAGGMFP